MCRQTDLSSISTEIVRLHHATGLQVDNLPRHVEAMPGADHRGDGFFTPARVRPLGRERTDSPPPGEAKRCIDRLIVGKLVCGGAVFLVHSGGAKALSQTGTAIASGGQ